MKTVIRAALASAAAAATVVALGAAPAQAVTAHYMYGLSDLEVPSAGGACDAILDSIAADTGIEDRRTLYSSTEFKKIRLRYFTDEHKRWEAEHS